MALSDTGTFPYNRGNKVLKRAFKRSYQYKIGTVLWASPAILLYYFTLFAFFSFLLHDMYQ